MPVPFADLQLQYQTIKGEIDGAIAAVIRDNAFIRGPYVDAFEAQFAEAVDVKHCVSCANGTDALYLAMAALKVQAGRRGHHHGAFVDQHVGDDHARRRHGRVRRHRRKRHSPSTPRRSKMPSHRGRWASYRFISTGSRRIWMRSWRSRTGTSFG